MPIESQEGRKKMAILHHDSGPRRQKPSKEKGASGKHGEKPVRIGVFGVFKEAASEWSEDKASRLAAALSYYTIFSIAPLLIIAIAVAGLVFGQEAAPTRFRRDRRHRGRSGRPGHPGHGEGAANPSAGIIATVVGVVTLLLGASGAFGQLQDALNTIWEVAQAGPGRQGFLRTASPLLLHGAGHRLPAAGVLGAERRPGGAWASSSSGFLPVPAAALRALNLGVSFAVIACSSPSSTRCCRT